MMTMGNSLMPAWNLSQYTNKHGCSVNCYLRYGMYLIDINFDGGIRYTLSTYNIRKNQGVPNDIPQDLMRSIRKNLWFLREIAYEEQYH